MDAPETANDRFGELHYLAGNHRNDAGEELVFKWRQRVAALIPESERTTAIPQQRADRFAIRPTALSREEKIAQIKAETVRLLSGLDPGSPIVYCDGGTDGNGANGECGASGYGVCVTRKQPDWTPEGQPHIEDHYFGPVIIDPTDIYWLGAMQSAVHGGDASGADVAAEPSDADKRAYVELDAELDTGKLEKAGEWLKAAKAHDRLSPHRGCLARDDKHSDAAIAYSKHGDYTKALARIRKALD
eukprot:COSAG01_NODE_14730_length_1417_cov_1.927921_1_plen_244_part_01